MKKYLIIFTAVITTLIICSCASSGNTNSEVTVETKDDACQKALNMRKLAESLMTKVPQNKSQGNIPGTDFVFYRKPNNWCMIQKNSSINNSLIRMSFQNNVLFSILNMKNGRLHGFHFLFYNNGNLSQSNSFVDGKIEGNAFYFLPDGSVYSTLTSKDSKPINGTSIGHFQTGPDKTIQIVAYSYKDGKLIKQEPIADNLKKQIKKYSGLN